MEDVIIIGAGLSGLSTAYNLKKKKINFKILEAQSSLGGRIRTLYGNNKTPMDMGATWFSKEHKNILALLKEINVGYFEQHTEGIALFETLSFEPPQKYFVPANSHSAYRVQGGTFRIIDALHQEIGNNNILLNTEIVKIVDEGNTVKLIDHLQNEFFCKHLVIAMPPRLIIKKIDFMPELPDSVKKVMSETQTWMSGSTKFSVEYRTPFWKENGFSGSVYSQSGFAPEIYDHTNFEQTTFALKGFLNATASHYTPEERKEKVIAQLNYYFGNEAKDYISYHDKIWNDKYISSKNDSFLQPHYNNGHSIFTDPQMNNKLFFCGTETSKAFGGYMEGAIISANQLVERVGILLAKK